MRRGAFLLPKGLLGGESGCFSPKEISGQVLLPKASDKGICQKEACFLHRAERASPLHPLP